MKFKDLLLPLGLALITTIAIRHFFFPDDSTSTAIRSGQSFVAPKSLQAARPLNREIDFIDEKRKHRPQITEVETKLARFEFSNDGATLERMDIRLPINGKPRFVSTVIPVGQHEREDKCFLIALGEKTPYYYELVGTKETDSEIVVHYRYSSPSSDVNINKIYTIFKETHKLNLKVEVEPKKALDTGVEVRIFYPSPFNLEIPGGPSSVVVNEKGSVVRKASANIDARRGWFEPALFGADNKYFLHTMIEDPDKFVRRAYYRGRGQEKLVSILEGPTVKEPASWTVSFYFGPKEEAAMARVDNRLEQTLDYSGVLAPISKGLLALLKYFYKYLGNYGLAILLMTLLMRLLLLPFTMRADQGVKKQAELKRKLKYVEQKYKHDKEALARAKADLISKHGMSGLGGCLPVLLQLPIFFALSRVLSSSIELYQAPFAFWITDLSVRDPYYVIPGLMVVSMLFQAAVGDKSQRFMFIAMALVVGALFSNLSAGLGLYIVTSTALGVVQTTVQKRMKKRTV